MAAMEKREEEINKFVSEEYWTIDAIFDCFEASLFKYKDKIINTFKK